jgi:hypothetical protein
MFLIYLHIGRERKRERRKSKSHTHKEKEEKERHTQREREGALAGLVNLSSRRIFAKRWRYWRSRGPILPGKRYETP